ncbi:hypothetical protein BJ875DRAFT_468683 [Amylocarpus encephaloides]|uniref:NAD(P)-binding protein n=1 Tax=Amylocarpus encephaloides TaxID=45428 RepID=A0A9P7YEP4_9HELO|nr:hypothetical protein BJ875DRAFT_468683 [Amylocarpus encephaloides]
MTNPSPRTGRLYNKRAIITGSSSGLGRAIAIAYAREGALLICADLTPHLPSPAPSILPTTEPTLPTHEYILSKIEGARAAFCKTDVREEEEVKTCVARCVDMWGSLDIIVNNAGIAPEVTHLTTPFPLRAHTLPTALFTSTISTNVLGPFLGCKYALSQFLAQVPPEKNSRGDIVRGVILNTASLGGLTTLGGACAYVTSKHAVVGLTKQIAGDYGMDGIRVNALCPSFIDTPLIASMICDAENPIAVAMKQKLVDRHPWGNLRKVEDVVGAAVFLVSEESQWMTGVPLVVDGGYSVA